MALTSSDRHGAITSFNSSDRKGAITSLNKKIN